MRLNPTTFYMEVEGKRAEDHPKRFTDINIHYVLEGDLAEDKVIRAIQLSKDKYCSVSHSLSASITATYSINGGTTKAL
jgi:putative redox protein